MVLSNKKLKQNIRSKLAESLAASEAQNHTGTKHTTDQDHHNLQTHQSLKSLLDSATQKPRLSKREKRRVKPLPLQRSIEVFNRSEDADTNKETEEGGSEGLDEGKNKKRKRNKEGKNVEEKEAKDLKKKKSNKKKKNKKKLKGKKGDNVEEKKGEIAHGGGEVQIFAETIKTNISNEKVDISTKVYVGGIPYYSTEDDIRSYFEGCGTITEVDCLKFPETGKFNGIAMINFKTEAAAKRALALDGSDMGGLFLKIQPYKTTRDKKVSDFAPAILEGYNRIYIGNLSWDITEDELKKLFSDCTIASIRFGEDKETGKFRGYAHVDFVDSLSLSMALKLDQNIVCGRPVRIRCAVPPKTVKTTLKAVPTGKKADDSKSVPISKKADDFTSVPTTNIEADDFTSVPTASFEADDNIVNSISRKIRGRTCYECGERGHLSLSCPKKQAADPTNSSKKDDDSKSLSTSKKAEDITPWPTTSKEADDNVVNAGSGKIRRRTCYECGEKGHLSSSCPKKQAADPTNSSAT